MLGPLLLLGCLASTAGEVPRVAVLYSSFPDGACAYRDEYDADLARLGWPAEEFGNTDIVRLAQGLDDFDVVICTAEWDTEHWQNLRTYAQQLRQFVRYGGVVLLTDTNSERQVNWLRSMEPGLDVEANGERCPSARRHAAWLDARHPLLAGTTDLPTPAMHLTSVSGHWQVLARCEQGRPILMVREPGDGLIVVTTASRASGFPDVTFLQNLWLWARDSGRIAAARDREETRYRTLTEAKALDARRIDPPVIDGIIEEDAWNRAAQTAQFVLPDNSAVAGQETRAYVGLDDCWLYLAFRCSDSDPAGIVMHAASGGQAVLDDDCVEVAIDPTGQRTNPLRFAVSACGATYAEGDVWWQAATQTGLRGWTDEMRIPLLMLGDLKAFAPDWAVSLTRRCPRTGEVSTWAPGDPGWGVLRKVGIDPDRFALRLNQIELRGSRLSASFTKPSYGDFRGVYIVECASPSGVTRETSRGIALGEFESALIETDHRMDEPGTWLLRARVEVDGGPVWFSEPMRHLTH
jgi:hypothetical protein